MTIPTPTKTRPIHIRVYPEQKSDIERACAILSEDTAQRFTQHDLIIWALMDFFAAHPELGTFSTYSGILRKQVEAQP
jgi:hypothetical protein